MAVEDVNEFELARKRAKQQASQASSERMGAIQRRFAALGAGPGSGARMKIEQEAENATQDQLQQANESIDVAERGEMRRRREVLEGRDFSKSEREATQAWQSGEGDKQRTFITGERTASQEFAAGEGLKGREFATSEREATQEWQTGEADTQRAFVATQQAAAERFQRGERLSAQEYQSAEAVLQRKWTDKANKIQRAWQAGEADKARQAQRELFTEQMDFEVKKFDENVRQFNQTFGEEVRINNQNIEFARQVLNEKGMMDKFMDSWGQWQEKRSNFGWMG